MRPLGRMVSFETTGRSVETTENVIFFRPLRGDDSFEATVKAILIS